MTNCAYIDSISKALTSVLILPARHPIFPRSGSRSRSRSSSSTAMDLWQRARVFAEETAKRSQEISISAVHRSQNFVSSLDLAAEATRTADLIRAEALRRADQIKTLVPPLPPLDPSPPPPAPLDLERFGVTDGLREFVKGITISTFRDFPMEDEVEMPEVTAVANVRQDLNKWQATHATLVLSEVKEISKFRYELCPRYMKERKFWRVYFILVNSFVAPYERKYMEELNMESLEQKQNDAKEIPSQAEPKETKLQSKTSASSTAEQDLDMFLLGDLGSSDEGPDDDNDDLDDDFDKKGNTPGLDSDDDHATIKK